MSQGGKRKFTWYLNMTSTPYYIRLGKVVERTSLSKSSIYRLIAEGSFPSQVLLGARTVAWVNQEIDEWCEKRLISR